MEHLSSPAEQPSGVTVRMREGRDPRQATGKPLRTGPDYERLEQDGLLIERNVAVPTRDGIRMLVDLYRPADGRADGPLPVLLGWSPYGKHHLRANLPWPAAGVEEGWCSPYTGFEAPDPAYWCANGYAVAYADPPGTWLSEGEMHHGGAQEAADCADLVDWLGELDWCNGKVGMTGVSYLACIQWQVGPLRPAHLAALNPWEGFSDLYREVAYHGGIRETHWFPAACGGLNWSLTRTEDTAANSLEHPLYDDYWASKENALEQIDVPIFVVASWSDQGLHLRGTLEAYERVGSRHKWLEVHGQKKWAYYYDPANVRRLRQFFDHFLKGEDDAVLAWPKVRLEVRERAAVATWLEAPRWPVPGTRHERLHLDAATGSLSPTPPTVEGVLDYDARAGSVVLDHRFATGTDVVGPMALRLWVEAVGSDDADLFVAVLKLDEDGRPVPFTFYALYDDGPAALGWLRASHRELDETRSRPGRPVHPHRREQRLEPGEAVPVDIEIWPSATRFAPGERLRLWIGGHDFYGDGPPGQPLALHEETRNQGTHVLRTGGRYDAHLLLPIVDAPGADDRSDEA